MFDFPENEEKILKFWRKKKIFEKSLKKGEKSPKFIFFEGPPYANARPGIHHVLARSYKDIIVRYKTMIGLKVERKAGWDTHGLPVEMEVEKKLGIKSKPEIEKIGIEKFITSCRDNIFTYKKQWEETTKRIGYWLDLDNAYVTCTNEYIESVWWILKQIWDKGLIYQDYKVVPYCPRCGTSLSDHEVAQGYKDTKDKSIYVKFKIRSSKFKDSFLLVWTTTPWTLPGNVALAINPNIKYVEIRIDNQHLILAKERLKIFDKKYKTIHEIEGKDLIGVKYEPLYNLKSQISNLKSYKVVSGDFVSTKEGTGIVHIAPAFGADDLELAKRENLPVIVNVDEQGKFKKEVESLANKYILDANPIIINDLIKRKLLFKEEIISHSYPYCWRCDTALMYYAKNSWYIKTTTIKNKMLDNNEKINWVPNYIKYGRFGNWLKENVDWAISRERFWGTPLPFWQCNKCKHTVCIGSIEELKSKGKRGKVVVRDLKDLHKPYIDEVIIECDKCGHEMRRVPEVLDVWFDSGAMPYAQWHYPFENKDKIDKKKAFPADFIAEGIDQTRGWFYTLLAISSLLDLGPAYKNVISLGLVLDKKGQKMSKSRGNAVWSEEVIPKYGADAVRLYFYLAPQGETFRFIEKDLAEVFRKFIFTMYNSFIFYKTYLPKNFKPNTSFESKDILDHWIISELNQVIGKITQNLEEYEVTKAARILYNFVIEDLSNWYIRRSRKRETEEFYQTLYYVLNTVVKLSAPFVPFISESVYQELMNSKESVHLEEWPKSDIKLINNNLNRQMDIVRRICELGLSIRAERKIKVRQPLQELRIEDRGLLAPHSSKSEVGRLERELLDLIKYELNVKEVKGLEGGKAKKLGKEWAVKEESGIKIALNTKITPQLQQEGTVRDIVRHIQELRRKHGFKAIERVSIFWQTNDRGLLGIMHKFTTIIEKETRSKLRQVQKIDKSNKASFSDKEIYFVFKQ
ncbi:MAG: isoleucine--tRNA ligase [Candidatus Berkelbacteria bacterium]|nr:isoleucine--tRNA ligase [Candidatus Berkelbacteria bacterium]